MKIFTKLQDWKIYENYISSYLTRGFVPTMGNLHKGHISLINYSKTENDKTIVSIFINPNQFEKYEDFIKYPRSLNNDLIILKQNNVDYCFLPIEEEILDKKYEYYIKEYNISNRMEGIQRPGHFSGVLTIIMKLFNIINPTNAYFGEKDYQQYELIKNMVNSFFLNITVKICPTIRESTGLAYSSRNTLLTKEQRKQADKFVHIFHTKNSIEQIKIELFKNGIYTEYLEEYKNRRFIAVRIGNIRLIDNYII